MRTEFSKTIEQLAKRNNKIIFLTSDLGFMAFENLQEMLKDRFINVGVSEQNMISMAASLSKEGLLPICYSIAPFAILKTMEQLKLDIALNNLNVKIIGNGGGYGYGIMGPTHHTLEDLGIISSLPNIHSFIPFCNEDVEEITVNMIDHVGPVYLRLEHGHLPNTLKLPSFNYIRQVAEGNKLTIISIGSISLNVYKALEKHKNLADHFIISKIPFELNNDIIQSLIKNKNLIVIEEHGRTGGIGENIASQILQKQIEIVTFKHLYAQGYPNNLYGSRDYHLKKTNLDVKSLEQFFLYYK